MNKENFARGGSALGRKKGNAAVIAIIIVIVAITAGIIGWNFAKKSQAPTQQVATQTTNTQLADATAQVVPQNAESSFQQDGNMIRGYGIEAYFEDGILGVNGTTINF
jgi:uncharacterized protein HemX